MLAQKKGDKVTVPIVAFWKNSLFFLFCFIFTFGHMATMGFFYPDLGRDSFPAVKCQQSLRGCSRNLQKGGISHWSKPFP